MRLLKHFSFILFLVFSTKAYNATITSQNSGPWSVPATWTGNILPLAGDDVIIQAGHTVNVDVPISINSVIVQGTLDVGNSNLTVNDGISAQTGGAISMGTGNLIVGGDFFNPGSGSFSPGNGTVTFNRNDGVQQTIGGPGTFYNLVFSGISQKYYYAANTTVLNNFTNNSGTEFYVTGGISNYTVNGITTNNGTIRFAGAGTPLRFNGDLMGTGSIQFFDPSNIVYVRGGNNAMSGGLVGCGTVIYDGPGPQTIFPAAYCFLEIQSSTTANVVSPITVNQNLIIGSTATLDGGSTTIDIGGNFTVDGSFIPGTGVVNFINSMTSQYLDGGAGTMTFYNFSISKPSGIVYLNRNIIVLNDIVINSGGLNGNSYQIDLNGNFVLNGTFNSTSTINFVGAAQQDIIGTGSMLTCTNFNVLNTSGPVIVASPSISLNVVGSTSIPSLTKLDLGVNSSHGLGTVTGSGMLAMSAPNFGTAVFPAGNFTNFLSPGGSGIVEYNGTNDYYIDNGGVPGNYNDVLISDAGVKYWAPSAVRQISGNLTVNPGATLTYSGAMGQTISGDLIVHGTFDHLSTGILVTATNVAVQSGGNFNMNGNVRITGGINNLGIFTSSPVSNLELTSAAPVSLSGNSITVGNLHLNNSPGVTVDVFASVRVLSNLEFISDIILKLNGADLILGPSATVTTPGSFSGLRMIETDGVLGGPGALIQEGNATGDFLKLYPIGMTGVYTPVNVSTMAGTITPIATLRMKPSNYLGSTDYVGKLIDFQSTGIAPSDFHFDFSFPPADLFGTPAEVVRDDGVVQNPVTGDYVNTGSYMFGVNSAGNNNINGQWIALSVVPVVSTVSPGNGCEGAPVTISGSGFTGATDVRFNGISASFLVSDNNTITTTVPVGATTGFVEVENPYGIGSSNPTTFTVDPATTGSAGADQNTCASTAVLITGATASGGTYSWTTSGDGTFDNPTLLNPTYTPGPNDDIAGVVTLTINISDVCGIITDDKSITIDPLPAAPAGTGSTICSGATASISASGSGTLQWFDLPSAGTNLQSGPSYTTPALIATTTYYVEDVVGSCVSSRTAVTVTVNTAPPTPGAVTGTDPVCTGGSGSYSITPVGGATSYNWTLPAGASIFSGATTPSITATFASTSGSVCVEAINACGTSAPSCFAVTISPMPIANAGSNQTICPGSTATLNGSVSFAGGGIWSTGGTGAFTPNATTLNAVYTPSPADISGGTVTLTLTTTGNGACSAVMSQMTITFTAPPAVSAGSDINLCATSAVLSGNTPGTGTGTWAVVSGTGSFSDPNDPVATVTGLSAGVNSFEWIIVDGSCQNRDTVVISRDDFPSTAAAGADQNICANNSVLAANTPSVGVGTWSFISGTGTFNAADPNSAITGLSNGVNELEWTITNGICPPSSDRVILNVSAAPNNTLTVTPNEDTLCFGENAVITINGSELGINYQAFLGVTPVGPLVAGNGGNQVITIPNSSFPVGVSSLTIEAQSACPAVTLAASPTIRKSTLPPAPSISPTGSSLLCNNVPVQLNVPAGFPNYQWYLNNSLLVGETGISVQVDVPGNYQLEVSDLLCKEKSIGFAVTSAATAPVVSSLGSSGISTQLTVPSGSPYYQWYTRGKAIHGANTNVLQAYYNAYYYVAVNFNNCRVVSDSFNLSNPSYAPLLKMNFFSNDSVIFIEEPEFENVSVYPNPADDAFQVVYEPTGKNNVIIELFDSMGDRILSRTFDGLTIISEEFYHLNLQSGIYMIRIIDGDQWIVRNVQIN